MQRKLCFYHDDMDGICSANTVLMARPGTECFQVDYEKPFPIDKIQPSDTVYIVDYALQPFSRMVELNEKCHLIWIDHHSSTIKDFEASGAKIDGVRDVNFAACVLSWKYFFPDEKLPDHINILAEFDTWQNQDKDRWEKVIVPFELAMLALPDLAVQPGRRIWESLMTASYVITEKIQEGRAIKAYLDKQNKDISGKYAFVVEIDGKKFITLNTAFRGSIQTESVYDPTKHDGICVYRWTGQEYTFSLYSTKPEMDCGAICQKYNGGGHRGAAGGRWTKEQFAEIFYKE